MSSYLVSTYKSGFVEGVHSGAIKKPWPSRFLLLSKPQQSIKQEWTKCLQTSTHCLRCLY